MMLSLDIANYALIDHLEITFDRGLNIVTGETGAGKSIMLGALSLLLGGRADMRVVRDSARKSVIEAEFLVEHDGPVNVMLREADIDTSDRCILRRELAPGGRSRAFINDTPVNLTLLHDVAIHLIDIHSQHQNLLLADSTFQLSIIDGLARDNSLLAEYRKAYNDYREVLNRYSALRDTLARDRADREYLEFQLQQLRDLNLQPGEQEKLEQEREMLANQTRINSHIGSCLEYLSDGQRSASELIGNALADCRALGNLVDDAEQLAQRLEAARIEVNDVADTLLSITRRLDADPSRLDRVEQRLDTIYSLSARHRVSTADGLIGVLSDLEQRVSAIARGDENLAALEDEARKAKKRAMALAEQLSATRRACSDTFAQALREKALPLGMPNLQCSIDITRGKLSPDGIDRIEFLFSFNKNQQLMPVGATASGGEISRLMLCVKSIVAENMELPTIIFDEIDTGVSGDIAARMADMMTDIAAHIQVVSITHLPQVAARGNTHYKVYKEDDDTATNTRVRRLDPDERVREIALMLSGTPDDPTAIAAARTLINRKTN